MVRARLPKLGLLGQFSVMSLVPIVLLGAVLARTVRDQVTDRSLANAEETAELISKSTVQAHLTPGDVTRGLDRAQGFHLSRPLPPQQFAEWIAGKPVASTARDVA